MGDLLCSLSRQGRYEFPLTTKEIPCAEHCFTRLVLLLFVRVWLTGHEAAHWPRMATPQAEVCIERSLHDEDPFAQTCTGRTSVRTTNQHARPIAAGYLDAIRVEALRSSLLLAIPARDLYLHGFAGCGLRVPRTPTHTTASAHMLRRFRTLGVWIQSFRMANTATSYLHTLLHPRL